LACSVSTLSYKYAIIYLAISCWYVFIIGTYVVLSVAAAIKELRAEGLPFMAATVRHYTLVAIAQQSGR
jgi:hypothetical protein